ncbi:MAG: hypothetical protein ABI305_13880 [Tepidiformaceae bacterium]
MSAARKRSARRSGSAAPAASTQQAPPQAQSKRPEYKPFEPEPLPKWQWFTIPVFFAFAIGGFIGLELGVVAGSTNNGRLTMAVAVIFALILGLSFSRIFTRLAVSKQWIKPRGQQRR